MGTTGIAGPFFDLIVAPLLALVVVGLLALVLRWAFGHNRSVVAGRPRRGAPDQYGLLVVVAEPATFIEAEMSRQHLEASGVRATLAPTTQGPRVLVFPEDERIARALLGQR